MKQQAFTSTYSFDIIPAMSMHRERERLLAEIYAQAQTKIADNDIWSADQHVFPKSKSPDNRILSAALRGRSFQDVIGERKENGLSTHTLELFGSGDFLQDRSVADSITGVRLTDKIYFTPTKPRPRPSHQSVIEGNIHDEDTWGKLATHMETNNIPAFDVIVCAPYAGWGFWSEKYSLPVQLDVYYPLLQRAYNILSPDGGTLYTEIPKDMHVWWRDARVWEWRMNRAGIKTEISNKYGFPYEVPTYATITKQPQSPESLVPLKGRFKMPEE